MVVACPLGASSLADSVSQHNLVLPRKVRVLVYSKDEMQAKAPGIARLDSRGGCPYVVRP
jgi:hypothetical protein